MIRKEQQNHFKTEQETFLQSVELAIQNEIRKNFGPVFVCIGGPSAAGKSTFTQQLAQRFPTSVVLNMDSYLIGAEEASTLNHTAPNPHKPFLAAVNPLAFDIGRLKADFLQLLSGKTIHKPVFDKKQNKRVRHENFEANTVVLIEGLHALNTEFAEHANFCIYVDAPLHDRLMRKVTRNFLQYGRNDLSWIITDYLEKNESSFKLYSNGLRKNAQFYFLNSGRATITTPHKSTKCESPERITNLFILQPKYSVGKLYQNEKIMVYFKENLAFFVYSQDNQIVIDEQINHEAVLSLQKFYTFLSIAKFSIPQ